LRRSGEHEVSLASAASVIRGMDPDKYEAVPLESRRKPLARRGGRAKDAAEVLKGGQRVMMTADPSDAALVRWTAAAGDNGSTWFSR